MATIQDFLSFTVDEIPVEKNFIIDGNEYKFLLQYNSFGDFYTMTIKNLNDEIQILIEMLFGKMTFGIQHYSTTAGTDDNPYE
mgnify:CR=1 FL=1